MSIPNQIRFESQVAATGRASCKICGFPIPKGSYVIKVLGDRINQSLDPECLNKLTLVLADYSRRGTFPAGYEPVVRAQNGKIKVGYYKKLGPGQFRFTAVQIIEPQKKGVSNE